jgi:hypothetical protein
LLLALVYMVVLSVSSKDGIKTQIPFLSRYSFATLFGQIPGKVHDQLRVVRWIDAVDPELNDYGPAMGSGEEETGTRHIRYPQCHVTLGSTHVSSVGFASCRCREGLPAV